MRYNIRQLDEMKHSPIRNYVIPGLTSWLIADNGKSGKVRMFESERHFAGDITPHSHRFDFTALVLEGTVKNHLWKMGRCNMVSDDNRKEHPSDLFQLERITYNGDIGKYVRTPDGSPREFWKRTRVYHAGSQYGMGFDEIHSIHFSKGAKVLFFEGPEVEDWSHVLHPVVDGEVIPTCKTEPWMFQRG